ncbi:MAG: HAMP domain-containing methyl-accepting chemotaxis protein [bacterium]|nr:HAMP domain-containing methyl-accepting chemotaxis protein [bacterium]
MGAAIFFVAALLAVVQYALSSTTAGFSRLIADDVAIMRHGNSAKIAFLESRRNEKDVLYNDDESLVKRIVAFSGKTIEEAKSVDTIVARIDDPSMVKIAAAVTKGSEEYQRLFKLAAAAQAGQPRMVATIPMRKAATETENQMNLLLEKVEQRIATAREETQQRTKLLESIVLASGFLVIALGFAAAFFLRAAIAKPLVRLRDRMTGLAKGDNQSEVPFVQRRDEIGKMAEALEFFRNCQIETEQLRTSQEAEQKSQIERANRVQASVTSFEKIVAQALGNADSCTAELEQASTSMAETARETSQRSSAVATASEQATQNVQTVSSAAEELSSSLAEINSRVAKSTEAAREGAAQANEANSRVVRLKESVLKIDSVANLINEIASQTNLLALNATIEAARAGEAGRGFAVVASEVKALATQTTKATDEIAAQIRAIHTETDQTVGSIETVTQNIVQLNEIVSSIALAVEQQGAATREIAASTCHAAAGTAEVMTNIQGVREASERTGEAAGKVLRVAGELSRNGGALKTQIEGFLKDVSAA